MKKYLCIAIMGALLASCSPRIVDHYHAVHDTTNTVKVERDSIHWRDSIFILQKGDTVYQYVEKWRDRYIHKTDTVRHAVHDTTFIRETVEKPLSPLQKAKINAFWSLIAIIAALLLWTFRKPLLALIRG